MPSLSEHVHTLATAEGRMIGTPGHDRARAYLVEQLAALDLRPVPSNADARGFEHPYRVGLPGDGAAALPRPLSRRAGVTLTNLLGVAPGRRPELAPIVLAAHYDTCGPLPGADDNAAAIAIALAVAARLRAEPGERDLIVALFDGEEPPCSFTPAMGSTYWYTRQRQTPVHCAIVLDLVGHDVELAGREDLVFVTGMESDPELVFADLEVPGIRVHPVLNRYVGDLSDHHVFRTHERPFLFLSCGRWRHYHQRTDTPDRLNYAKMAAIVELTEALVRRTDAATLAGPFGAGDTLALELAAIRRHFGAALGGGAKLLGRRGVDAFVAMAMATWSL